LLTLPISFKLVEWILESIRSPADLLPPFRLARHFDRTCLSDSRTDLLPQFQDELPSGDRDRRRRNLAGLVGGIHYNSCATEQQRLFRPRVQRFEDCDYTRRFRMVRFCAALCITGQ